jgi:MFS family permease
MSKERGSSVSDAAPDGLDRELGHSQSQEIIIKEKHHAAHPPPPQRSLARSIAIVATCTAAMIVNVSNSTSVSISLPDIGKAIDIQEDQLQWLLSAYSLSAGCLLLFFGRLADLYGRKRGFMIGTLWQCAFAIGCGLSQDGLTLAILRGCQGMGAAATIPSAIGILAHSFPPSRARSTAFATFAAGAPVGAAFGTIIGGVLTQLTTEHWRAAFFMAAGFSAMCFIGGVLSFDKDKVSSEADRRVDWIGALLVTSGLVLVVFVLGQGPVTGWSDPYIIVLLILGVILVGMFLLWERKLETALASPDKPKSFWTPPPLVKPSLWARAKWRMTVILAIAFLNWSGFLCWTFWVQLYYQNYLHLTPTNTMIRFIPMFVMGIICNLFVAMVVSRLPLVVFVVSGTVITGFACVLFALIDTASPYWAFGFPSTVLVAFGADFVYAAGTLFISSIALPHEQSVAGGLFQTMTQLGTAFGLTVSTIVFNSVVSQESAKLGITVDASGSNAPESAQLMGYRAAQWTGAGFPFLAAILAAIFLRRVGIVGHKRHPARDAESDQTLTVQSQALPSPTNAAMSV